MANKVLVLGESGTGKSRAIKNLDPSSTFIVCPDEKGLPFAGWKGNYKTVMKEDGKLDADKSNFFKTTSPVTIYKLIEYISSSRKDIKVIVIDTLTLMMVSSFMGTLSEKGYDKFNNQALDVYNILKLIDRLREDLTVFVLAHTETGENGSTELFIPGGKLVKEKAKPAAMFTVLLETFVNQTESGAEYGFITQNNGKNTAKSPEGMFDKVKIPNDFKYVLDCINKYEN